jgi:hypothetical protein
VETWKSVRRNALAGIICFLTTTLEKIVGVKANKIAQS